MRRGKKRSKYALRPRDTPYMLWVKSLSCAVLEFWMPWEHEIGTCDGPIQADHMGRRGIGQKAADDTCAPMCRRHHRERTDHSGVFRHATREQAREWCAGVVRDIREIWSATCGPGIY